jgi:hypothetical protein
MNHPLQGDAIMVYKQIVSADALSDVIAMPLDIQEQTRRSNYSGSA